MVKRRFLGWCSIAALAVFAPPSPARADLRDDATRIARLWSAEGAVVRRAAPIFLENGRTRVVDLAALAPSSAAGECLTLAVVAPRTGELVVATGPKDIEDMALLAMAMGEGGPSRIDSEAGFASSTRCGADAERLGRAVLLQRASRTTIEILLARSSAALPSVASLLPERVTGPSAPRGTPGRSLEIGPIAARLARAEARARAEGAEEVSRTLQRPPGSGRGDIALTLAPGCHRIELFAEARSGPRFPADVDAELRLPSGQVPVRDRGDATDARLDTCVGEETRALLGYVGAPGAAAVHVADARWPLPEALPSRWGPRLRAAAFAALRRRRTPVPSGEPVAESFGVQGVTPVPLPVEPGRCYLAVAALAQGTARGMRLSAPVGARPVIDEVGQRPEGVAITFCAESREVVPLSVELQSSGGWWLLAAWQLGPVEAKLGEKASRP